MLNKYLDLGGNFEKIPTFQLIIGISVIAPHEWWYYQCVKSGLCNQTKDFSNWTPTPNARVYEFAPGSMIGTPDYLDGV